MKQLSILLLSFILYYTVNAQNNYIYKWIDSTIIPDSTMFGSTINVDIDDDSIIDLAIFYVKSATGDSVITEDTTLYIEDTIDITSIMFDDDSLAFVMNELGDEVNDSTFDILSQDSFTLLNDSSFYWSNGIANAYSLTFGKRYINVNSDINYIGGCYNNGLKYFGFKINKAISGNLGWHYGWLRIEHKDTYLRIVDVYVSKSIQTPIRIGHL